MINAGIGIELIKEGRSDRLSGTCERDGINGQENDKTDKMMIMVKKDVRWKMR